MKKPFIYVLKIYSSFYWIIERDCLVYWIKLCCIITYFIKWWICNLSKA